MAASDQTVAALLQQIQELSPEELRDNKQARKKAVDLSRKLAASLEDPDNKPTDLALSPFVAIATRTAIDLNLFTLLESNGKPMSTFELAEKSGGEVLLLSRLLRLLAASGYLQEESADLWMANPTTRSMASQVYTSGFRFIWDVIIMSGVKAHEFLRGTGHKSPGDPTNGFLQYNFKTKKNLFELLHTLPPLLRDFNIYMGNAMGARLYWYDWYPVEEQLLVDLDPSLPLLVDIGGGKGHDLEAFQRKFPGRGRLILQELPQVLEGIGENGLDPVIERHTYDFFTQQPIQSARAYFFHHIFHDWSESYALPILAQLRGAMRPGYSKLLIHDLVLPDSRASAYQCTWDMTMMTVNGGIERSRKQWTDLLSKAGFHILKFWIDDEDADGLVEAVI